MRDRPRFRRGFTLFTMLAALILLTVFALVSARFFRANLRTTQLATEGFDAAARFDAMTRQLRDDAWNSSHIGADAGNLRLTLGNKSEVTWEIARDGTVLRTEQSAGKSHKRRWTGVGAGLSFAADPGRATLRVQTSSGRITEQMVFVSQLILAGGGKP